MDKPKTVQDLVSDIEAYCTGDGTHIFRGTNQKFGKVTSTLYRDYEEEEIFTDYFQPIHIEKEIVEQARKQFPDATSVKEILTDLRHFGAATTLIDFSRSLPVALFFACNGEPDEDGCLIVLNTDDIRKIDDIDYDIREMEIGILDPARTTLSRARVEFQNSVFIHAPGGCIPDNTYNCFRIPKKLKADVLRYLDHFCNIDEATIYNDLFGFINNQRNFNTAVTSFYRGLAKANARNFEEAIKDYDEAIRLKPDYAEAYNNRGVAKAGLGHFEEAIKDYDEAIRLQRDLAGAYNNRGNAKVGLGRIEEAIKDYDEAIRLKDDYAEAYNNRGNAKAGLGHFEEANKDYNEAIRLKPDYAEAYNNRGLANRNLGNLDDARDDFRTALDLATRQNNQEHVRMAQNALSNLDNHGGPEPD